MKNAIYRTAICLAVATAVLQAWILLWTRVLGVGFDVDLLEKPVKLSKFDFYKAGVVSILDGVHVPLYPVLGEGWAGLAASAVVAILLLRRLVLWLRFRSASPPATLGWAGAILLGICLLSLLAAVVALFTSQTIAAASERARLLLPFGALSLPGLLALPGKCVFGVTLLAIELHSLRLEGWWPKTRVDAALPRPTLNAAWTVGGVAVTMVYIWGVFPTALIHKHLCNTRGGEHVYAKVDAKNYAVRGEASRGFRFPQAIEDVLSRRVDFVELILDPENHAQRNSMYQYLGTMEPKGAVFRVSLADAGSAGCVNPRLDRGMTPVESGRCLQFVPVEKPSSRYRVEAVNRESASRFTPHIVAEGTRVIDGEGGALLGEDMTFTNASQLAFFVLGDKNVDSCPRPTERKRVVHTKVLLGDR